jgi:hypothetical protein
MNILNCYLYYLSNLIEDDINKNEMKRKQNEQYWNNNQPKLTLTETQSNSNEQKFIIARFPGIQWTRLRLDMYGNTTPYSQSYVIIWIVLLPLLKLINEKLMNTIQRDIPQW